MTTIPHSRMGRGGRRQRNANSAEKLNSDVVGVKEV